MEGNACNKLITIVKYKTRPFKSLSTWQTQAKASVADTDGGEGNFNASGVVSFSPVPPPLPYPGEQTLAAVACSATRRCQRYFMTN
ncbi:hypothetical protein QE152_g33867 [Popillia japonica]|uniref:Uncharacterized protein n=1 Tax=Popillia japonica TaxID=7064 RepID=A0AAW1IUR1_POPJA